MPVRTPQQRGEVKSHGHNQLPRRYLLSVESGRSDRTSEGGLNRHDEQHRPKTTRGGKKALARIQHLPPTTEDHPPQPVQMQAATEQKEYQQRHQDGMLKPAAYCLRTLPPTKHKYTQRQRNSHNWLHV